MAMTLGPHPEIREKLPRVFATGWLASINNDVAVTAPIVPVIIAVVTFGNA